VEAVFILPVIVPCLRLPSARLFYPQVALLASPLANKKPGNVWKIARWTRTFAAEQGKSNDKLADLPNLSSTCSTIEVERERRVDYRKMNERPFSDERGLFFVPRTKQ
jgi:hypothetical protein